MLMCDCLIRLLYRWDQGQIPSLSDELVKEKVSFILWQALMHTLQKQRPDGSWGSKPFREVTAYAVITLANLASLPLPPELRCQVESAIAQGRSFIRNATNAPDTDYIWIAKTTYSPLSISKAYTLAALKAKSPKYSLGAKTEELFHLPALRKYSNMFLRFRTLKAFPKWRIMGCVVESHFFLQQLTKLRHEIFDRNGMKDDEYIAFIPMTVSLANNLGCSFLEADILRDMMILILRVYQMDEYMEHVIARDFRDSLGKVKELINGLFGTPRQKRNVKPRSNGMENGMETGHGGTIKNGVNGHIESEHVHKSALMPELRAAHDKLKALVESVLYHPSVTAARPYDQSKLQYELRTCLLSHITQIEDSQDYYDRVQAEERSMVERIPQGSYHSWLHTVAASHSCAPLSLAYLLCFHRENSNRETTAGERYLVQDLCMHMSNKARLENDRASLVRDRKEKNLNSLDFPEFQGVPARSDRSSADAKNQLSQIIEYERKCCDLAFEGLERLQTRRGSHKEGLVGFLKFYFFLTDIYNDVYSMRDISCEA